jgi:ParB/RepB/Spo0J family partition protein
MTPERTIQLIPINTIDRDGQNHRVKVPGDAEAIRQLAESMRQNNQLQPACVLHRPPGRPLLVYGFRRVAAAELLGWTEIAAEVIETPLQPADVARLRAVENLDRKDLNPIEEAIAVAQLLDACDGDVSRCAATLGRSESWVRDRGYLGRLGPAARLAVIDGRLLLGHAREIAKVPDHDVQETLAQWAKVGDDGTCHLRIGQLRRSVEERMSNLRSVPWQLEVDFAGKPACSACPHNSSNDRNLFEHDEPGKPAPEAFCMSPACYKAKHDAAQKALDKAVNKIVNQGLAANEKAVDRVSPDFLKPARVVREVKKVRGEDVEREGRPKDEGKGEADEQERQRQQDATFAWQDAVREWEEATLAQIEEAATGHPYRLAALLMLDATPWAKQMGEYGKTPDEIDKLIVEGVPLLDLVARADVAAIDKLRQHIEETSDGFPYIQLMDGCGPKLLGELARRWGREPGDAPKLDDYLNVRRESGAEDPASPEPDTTAEDPEPQEPPANPPEGEILDRAATTDADAMRAKMEETARAANKYQLIDVLDRINRQPTGDGWDDLRREVTEAELERRKQPDELEGLGISDALAAKLRRHGLLTIAAIEAAGGEGLANLADLGETEGRFGPREIGHIRKAIGAREKELAAQVVGN